MAGRRIPSAERSPPEVPSWTMRPHLTSLEPVVDLAIRVVGSGIEIFAVLAIVAGIA